MVYDDLITLLHDVDLVGGGMLCTGGLPWYLTMTFSPTSHATNLTGDFNQSIKRYHHHSIIYFTLSMLLPQYRAGQTRSILLCIFAWYRGVLRDFITTDEIPGKTPRWAWILPRHGYWSLERSHPTTGLCCSLTHKLIMTYWSHYSKIEVSIQIWRDRIRQQKVCEGCEIVLLVVGGLRLVALPDYTPVGPPWSKSRQDYQRLDFSCFVPPE